MLNDILFFAGTFLAFGIVIYLATGGSERRRTKKRIERVRARRSGIAPKQSADLSLRRKTNQPKGVTYWLSKPLPNFKRLGDRLQRAGVTVTPKQYALRRIVALILIMLAVYVYKHNLLMGFFLGIILGVWVPLKALQFRINKQTKAFLKLFPDAIDLIVRGLRSGLPVSESIVLVGHEVPDPVGAVFRNISATMKLGVTLEKALAETAKQLDMTEFNFFTTSITLQRETGGNLSEILSNLSEVLRMRVMMRLKIKALSSEARASSYIIGALPFVVMTIVSVISPDYMDPLWNDYRGNVMAMIAAGMMTFGMWVMNRMTKFEI